MTETLTDRIKRHEGFTHVPKTDAKGMYVIGHGHDIAPDQVQEYANGISETDAEDLLQADIEKAKDQANTAFPWLDMMDRVRQEVVYEMVFQIGIMGVIKFKNTMQALRSGDYDGAVQGMLDSAWHKETPGRCEELAGLMLHGCEITG